MSDRESRARIAARLRDTQRRQQRRELLLTTAVIVGGGLLIAGWSLGWFATEITLESSDGHWADRESLDERRDYTDSVALFMQYRIECGAPEAELYRATARPWWNPFLWPSLIADEKWSIPYREPLGRAEPTGIPEVSCTPVRGAWERADRQADAYLESL